jgi:hypothetical protein
MCDCHTCDNDCDRFIAAQEDPRTTGALVSMFCNPIHVLLMTGGRIEGIGKLQKILAFMRGGEGLLANVNVNHVLVQECAPVGAHAIVDCAPPPAEGEFATLEIATRFRSGTPVVDRLLVDVATGWAAIEADGMLFAADIVWDPQAIPFRSYFGFLLGYAFSSGSAWSDMSEADLGKVIGRATILTPVAAAADLNSALKTLDQKGATAWKKSEAEAYCATIRSVQPDIVFSGFADYRVPAASQACALPADRVGQVIELVQYELLSLTRRH